MIVRLGYVGLCVTDLEKAREFYCGLLGFRLARQSKGRLYLRAVAEWSVWSLCLVEADGPGVFRVAFKVDNEVSLEALRQLHEEKGYRWQWIEPDLESERGRALAVETPDGWPVEFYANFKELEARGPGGTTLPVRTAHLDNGIPPFRIDHVNLGVEDVQGSLEYWRDSLGFVLSEYVVNNEGEIIGAWLRRRRASHDVAIRRPSVWQQDRIPRPEFHHVAYWLETPLAVIRVADILADAGMQELIEYGPGRHGGTNGLFIYIRDPFGNRIEFFTGDYEKDLDGQPVRWTEHEYRTRALSWWGQQPPKEWGKGLPVRSI